MATIIRTKKGLPIQVSGRKDKLPVFPLRSDVLFPGVTLTIPVGRREDIKLIRHCQSEDKQLVVSYSPAQLAEQSDTSIHQVGVVATICDSKERPDGSLSVTIEGLHRAAIDKVIRSEPFLLATV
ncbi:MAG: LON peptidase substrate-binding domain-containing protein, partial [Deltaproteobacteria bacterium]|nr:LON peptidase substrate-binding domain-containing protein [Deltaproteobacteria bacterium]